jgi:pyruvate,water dikinase
MTDKITGLGAVKGTATGKAVDVLSNDFKEGDVLVATMTTPDHLPKMMKASAFITEKGSVTCHAAIIARELGKPCIVRVGSEVWDAINQVVTVSVEDYKENSITW